MFDTAQIYICSINSLIVAERTDESGKKLRPSVAAGCCQSLSAVVDGSALAHYQVGIYFNPVTVNGRHLPAVVSDHFLIIS